MKRMEIYSMDNILRNIKSLRDSKNWSQEGAAEGLKISSRMYSAYERGVSVMSYKLIGDIAKLYGVSLDALYSDDVIEYLKKNGASRVKMEEPKEEYFKKEEGKKVSIQLDLSNSEELRIFKQYLGAQYAARLA